MQHREIEKVEFGERLKMFRSKKMLSQGQLAKMSGTTVSQISRYENGLTLPNGLVLQRLCDALKIGYSELTGNTNDTIVTTADFEITLRKALELPHANLITIKDVIDKFIEINNIRTSLLK
ncbi:helix-turn-helix domain-containing protein [Pedobacter sp. UBA5917]|jgi:transcriptional regulator with XRE-family HTH domain|uniref:helix-turn-helix domain-containing protein n=1 Tax=Pedobacter sp. UBA5917 TaxID=1947061 RepID=UPI0025DA2E5B|nr:helix-turn-helix transcriptional regulator [Pedobacter sp. UBA5917]